MRLDIMTDIETLGTNNDSTVFQIAAIAFDISTGEYIQKFSKTADISKSERPLKVTGGTLKWWLNTDKELLAELINNGEGSTEQLIRDFHHWICELNKPEENEVFLWGNGILFDNEKIKNQFESLGLRYPIYYRNDRDLRTLTDLASAKEGMPVMELRKKYMLKDIKLHDAYDDVINQIHLATTCYNILIK